MPVKKRVLDVLDAVQVDAKVVVYKSPILIVIGIVIHYVNTNAILIVIGNVEVLAEHLREALVVHAVELALENAILGAQSSVQINVLLDVLEMDTVIPAEVIVYQRAVLVHVKECVLDHAMDYAKMRAVMVVNKLVVHHVA